MSADSKRIIEALLFVAETPLSVAQLAQAMDLSDKPAIQTALEELRDEYQGLGRSFEVVEVAGGWSFRTKPELASWLRGLRKEQVTRLSRAALETLAIIAYKQPVLKADIERLRGVEVGGVLRMLMEKELVKVAGRRDLPGRPLIYGTTRRFLEVFDLKDLKDLPTLEEMEALAGPAELSLPLEEMAPEGREDAGRQDEQDEYGREVDEQGPEEADDTAPGHDDPSHDDPSHDIAADDQPADGQPPLEEEPAPQPEDPSPPSGPEAAGEPAQADTPLPQEPTPAPQEPMGAEEDPLGEDGDCDPPPEAAPPSEGRMPDPFPLPGDDEPDPQAR